MTTFYLDTSVAGRAMLRHSPTAVAWFVDAAESDELVSSRLLKTELTRLARREGIPFAERDEVLDFVGVIPIDHAVLIEAEAIVPHVRALDAIHLGTALRSGIEDLVIVSHDARMLEVASQMGLATLDPCAGE
ncbi:type II toxin-antitoxin system VapC family toxin [Agrococcus sp. Marseille-Q4369]|uniref:type II toxin-antitoxin system VapC family toxin n=1 Tax=Agrococcus sp. Marseille-Q4369 TaxID=2810513 RepID=UPI00201662AC|nr:type II toxin-antitoxin system VapC family toxin [Agrococcus sp. Marseille-Q4369]